MLNDIQQSPFGIYCVTLVRSSMLRKYGIILHVCIEEAWHLFALNMNTSGRRVVFQL